MVAETWTPADIAKLTVLWGRGLSTIEISRRIPHSKDAICGKRRRLGLPERPSPIALRERINLDFDVIHNWRRQGISWAKISVTLGHDKNFISMWYQSVCNERGITQAAQRVGLTGGGAAPRKRVRPATVEAPPPAPIPHPAAPVEAPDGLLEDAIAQLPAARSASLCCWPIGEPREPGFRWCDDARLLGRPYCEAHCREAYSGKRWAA